SPTSSSSGSASTPGAWRYGRTCGGWASPSLRRSTAGPWGEAFWTKSAPATPTRRVRGGLRPPRARATPNPQFSSAPSGGWKAANRWGLTGDHFDAQEALRIGMVNEVVPHDQLMEAARALAKRICLVPEPSVRLNKAVTMMGMQAAGVYSGLLLEGALGA